ncbi:MFS transporter [Acrocarpospora phusangensis]|nr:MFS transporter [Acrocarpospora phusangensis]
MRNRDFRLHWTGQTVSWIGSEITEIAFPMVAILTLSATATDLGLINAARMAPAIVATLFAGLLVDRLRRRRTMLVTNLGRAAVVATVPFLGFVDGLSVASLCVLGFLLGLLTIVFDLASHSFLPTLVPKDQLGVANSRLQMSLNIARTAGAGLGGLLVAFLRAPVALLVDAASYLVSALTLSLIRTPDEKPVREESVRTGVWAEIMTGLRFTFGNRYLRAITLSSAVFNFGIQVFLTLFLLHGAREADLSVATLGFIMAIGSLGGVAGAMAMPKVVGRLGLGKSVLVGISIAAVGPLAVPLVIQPAFVSVPAYTVSFFLTLFGVVLWSICAAVIRQSLTPNEILGRATASERFVTASLLPIASLLAGVLGDALGTRWAVLIGVLCLPLALLPILFSPLLRLRGPEDAE